MIVEPSEVDITSRRVRDRALVDSHCSGDPDAFGSIVSDHYRVLLAQAERRLGSRIDAEDAVQETFERAFRAVCRFGGDGEFRLGAWLSRILTNVCNDHGGRRVSERGASERLAGHSVASPDVFESVSDPAVLRAVHEAIDALPASQRDTFVLKEMDGLSYDQVAGRLEISEESARARVHRAKAALQRSLALTRAALGGFIAIPVGLRSAFRRMTGHAPAAAPELATSSTVSTVATQVAVNPMTQALVTVAPTGAFRGMAALGVAAGLAVTGALAVPAITSDNGPAQETKAEATAAAAPSAELASSGRAVIDLKAPPVVAVETPPVPVTSSAPVRAAVPVDTWWDEDQVAPLFAEPAPTLPIGSPCASPDGSGAVRAAGASRVVSRIDLAPTELSPDEADATFKFSQSAGFAHDNASTEPLTVSGQVCLQGDAGMLRVDLQSAGKSAHLEAVLVSSNSDKSGVYIFRGTATAAVDELLPWETRSDFLARLIVRVDEATGKKTAELGIAFYANDGSEQGDVYDITEPPASPGTDAGAAPPAATPAEPGAHPSDPSGSEPPASTPAAPDPPAADPTGPSGDEPSADVPPANGPEQPPSPGAEVTAS